MSEMTTQDELVALVMAATSDRMAEIQAAKAAADEAQAKAAQALAEAAEMHATAMRISAQAEVDRQNLAGKQAELDAFQHTLSDHNQALSSEKAKWESVREQVDADQAQRATTFVKWNDELAQRETAVYAREVAVEERETTVAGLAKWNDLRLKKLQDAMIAVEPPTATFADALSDLFKKYYDIPSDEFAAAIKNEVPITFLKEALNLLGPSPRDMPMPPAPDTQPPVSPANGPPKDVA